MNRRQQAKIFASTFLFIFFIKMVISLAPLLADHVDSRIVHAVIMQLEIKASPDKGMDEKVKEDFPKDFITSRVGVDFNNHILYVRAQHLFLDEGRHLRTFYPAVLTPPPNV